MSIALFVLLVGGLIIERLLEVRASNDNMARLLAEGAREHSSGHYPAIIAMHVLWFACVIIEWRWSAEALPAYWLLPFAIFVLAQLLRYSSRRALSGRWTTRIVTLAGKPLVASGPYRYMRHPIYVAVALELASVPMIFGLWRSAILFSLLNAAMLLGVRIPAEDRALRGVANEDTAPE